MTYRHSLLAAASLIAAFAAAPLAAKEPIRVERTNAETVALLRDEAAPAKLWLSTDAVLDAGDRLVAERSTAARTEVALPTATRAYLLVQGADGQTHAVAERELPLQQSSNFRDVGGYVTSDGRTVRWGKVFRSGALPLLTESDYSLVKDLHIGAIVDLRSLEEREVAPTLLDDRTGAMFLANDYSIKPLMAGYQSGNGENTYQGMETMLAPQYRMMFRRILAGEGAVMYHCSAGQDRTGIATALLYDVLGVDREQILKDYHLSTALRRPQWEMPDVDPANHPGNFIVQYYMAARAKGQPKAEPLFTPSGASHLAQFFTYVDQKYGGTAGYLEQVLGITPEEQVQLRTIMLD